MSRVHFIPKTAPATAAEQITEIKDQIETVKAPLAVHHFADFVQLLVEAPQGHRFVQWMTCNSLNNFIIAQCQAHLRQQRYIEQGEQEVNKSVDYLRDKGADQQTIDKWNEMNAALAAVVESYASRIEQGHEAVVQPLDVVEHLVAIRSAIAANMTKHDPSKRNQAQSLADSLAYRLKRIPAVDEKRMLQIHQATQIPLDILRKVDLDSQISDRLQLVRDSGHIIELAEQAEWKHNQLDIDDIDEMFVGLPVQTRYRLIGGVCRSLKMAMEAEVKALIRFGRMDSVTNRILIAEVLDGYTSYFHQFVHDNADELADYEARGFGLPTLDEIMADRPKA